MAGLSNVDIELVKAFRALDATTTEPRRICIEIISDVLLQHHAVTLEDGLTRFCQG
jgi:hypothetical protein